MAFTEFCCRSGGSNLNAGTRTGNSTEPGTAAFKVYVSGSWVQATRTFTPAGGANPTTDGIAVGDFVSVYPDAATVSPYVARITTVGATTFVTSATAFSGTAPVDGVTNTSAAIGGAWKGPNAAEAFPIGFVTAALTDASINYPRINFKNDATYSITAATTAAAGPAVYQGYTSAYGDLGKATIDGTIVGASFILLTGGNDTVLADIIGQNNGTTGSATGISWNATRCIAIRCVVNNVRGLGIVCGATGTLIQCEAYACNLSNTASIAGISTIGGTLVRCISHDNAGSNSSGFISSGSASAALIGCIADTNGAKGFLNTATGKTTWIGCDAYNNGSDGLACTTTANVHIENCNFIKNGGWGILFTTATFRLGFILNCGFGAGTQVNTSGTVTLAFGVVESGSVTYAADVTPWVAPTTGNFSVNLPAAINAGIGSFTETQASYTGTVGFPVIGAAQTLVTAMLAVGAGLLRLLGVGR